MGRMKSPEYVSAALNEAGIPGIRYLDQGSRALPPPIPNAVLRANPDFAQVPKPTHNYVIFDPNKLDIRKMYAVPGAVGAAGMGTLAAQDNYQPQ
jgi:hypothetical protein